MFFFKKKKKKGFPEKYKRYNLSRKHKTDLICHAPFNNLYFNSRGYVGVCWLSFIYNSNYRYPDKSIREIWFKEFKFLRDKIKKFDLSSCKTCDKNIMKGNYTTVLAKAYDHLSPGEKYPHIMEFELGNNCNLECIMCNGELSSMIRKNREKRSVLKSPYDDNFVEELKEFIPHLKEARFNGGEPWLIPINYNLFEVIMELNPKTKMTIATNGNVMSEKIKEYLKKGNFHINISMDSLEKEMYEHIRKRSSFEKLMKNFEFYKKFCKENNRTLVIVTNPFNFNYKEMPKFIEFANRNDLPIWFNTIVNPREMGFLDLKLEKLEEIYNYFLGYEFEKTTSKHSHHNFRMFDSLMNQQIKSLIIKRKTENR